MWPLIIRAETLGRKGSLYSFLLIFASCFVCCPVLIIGGIILVTGIPVEGTADEGWVRRAEGIWSRGM